MNFDNYTFSDTKTAKTLPLISPHPYNNKGFRRLSKNVPLKKKGFTLAETLITLTIIGVIAALTIPTLISKYQKHTYVTRLKKVYSQLSTAFKLLPMSEGCSAGDFNCLEGTYFLMKPDNLKTVELINRQLKGTIETGQKCSSYKGEFLCSHCLILEDGASIYYCASSIGVDVNGAQGPNKIGRDQFSFEVGSFERYGKVLDGTLTPHGAKNDLDTTRIWNESNCNSNNLTRSCTGRVLEENAMNY